MRTTLVLGVGLVLAGCGDATEDCDGEGCGDDVIVVDDTEAVDTDLPLDWDPGPGDTDPPADTDPVPDTDDTDPGPLTAAACFDGQFVNPPTDGPDYDQFAPTVGSHCLGTNQQDIRRVQRVVFLGDSVTTGTPDALGGLQLSPKYYRAILADKLATRFGLQAPDLLWKANVDSLWDQSIALDASGDFANCARFGARTDDYLRDNTMLETCFPASERNKTTLTVLTMGGNDIASITQEGLDGVPPADIWPKVHDFVQLQEDAIAWLKDPARFPNGNFVVFANLHEFTDGTGDTSSCIPANLVGFGGQWDDTQALTDMVVWANEQYLRIAKDHGADMVFMLESFCGHGFRRDDPTSPCYRGPNQPLWLDPLTCTHPNELGHQKLANLFFQTVKE